MEKNKKSLSLGIIATLLFHITVIVILIFLGFKPAPPPFPEPDGIIISFGNTDNGLGEPQPPANQQQPLYSLYMLNNFLINPGVAGCDENSPIDITARQQWAGITDAPVTESLSGHTALGRDDTYGIGGFLYNDQFGPVRSTGVHCVFAYPINLNSKTKLSMGLSFSAFQYTINEQNLNIINSNDNAINGKLESVWSPDADAGLYLYNNRYFAGLSSIQLIQFKLNFGNNDDLNKIVRHYYLYGGYKFQVSKDIEIEPSLLTKATEQTPLQLDLNAKFYYKKIIG